MRVVVTGALGHIGSRLIRDLATAWPGIQIVMLDNLATERYASLFDLPGSASYEFIEGDVLQADLRRIFSNADAVVHLAAITHTTHAGLDDEMRRVNVDGTERVARACVSTGAAMLFPSTTSVYGVAHGVVDEDCLELRPHSPYAAWKLQSEEALLEMRAGDGLALTIFRMGTVFGPSVGMRFQTAVNRFCWRAVNGSPIEIWRTASEQFRPYLDLVDAVRAMRFVLRRRLFDGRIYNVATTNATVTDVVNVLARMVPDLQTVSIDSPLMNTWSYCADSSRLSRLGFEFRGSLEQGISDTVKAISGHRRITEPTGGAR